MTIMKWMLFTPEQAEALVRDFPEQGGWLIEVEKDDLGKEIEEVDRPILGKFVMCEQLLFDDQASLSACITATGQYKIYVADSAKLF